MRISDWSSDVCSSDLESSLDQIEDRPRITHFGVGKRWPHPGAESVRFDLAQCHRHRSNVVEPSVIAIRIAERVIDVGGGIERSIPSEEGSATNLAWDAATALMIVENTRSDEPKSELQ